MTAIRFYTDIGERVGPLFERKTARWGASVRTAARQTAKDAANSILLLGQGDIARAGDFGTRWTQGLHVDVSEGGGNIRIQVSHDVPYFSVFERGKTIQGRPLLWIPLGFATDAKGVWARDFPDPLFRVDRKAGGAPLLLSTIDKKPKYFGRSSVTIPKKFHITEIARTIAKDLRSIYNKNLEEAKGA
jgi:hypothetical protein